MTFQVVPNTAEFRLKYSDGSSLTWENVVHYRDTVAGWGAVQQEAMLDDLEGWWTSNGRPLVSSVLQLDTITGRDLGTEFGVQTARAVGTAGTRSGTVFVTSVPIRVMFRCDPGAPPRQGALYHSGAVEADVGAATFETSFATAVEAAYTAMVALSGIGTAAFVVVSRFMTVGDPPEQVKRDPAVTNTIDDVLTRRTVSTQKRRRLREPIYISPS